MNRKVRIASAMLVATGLLTAAPLQAFAKEMPTASHSAHSRWYDHSKGDEYQGSSSNSQHGRVSASVLAGMLRGLVRRETAVVNTAESKWMSLTGMSPTVTTSVYGSVYGYVYGKVPSVAQGTLSALQSDIQSFNSELTTGTSSMSHLLSTLRTMAQDASTLRSTISYVIKHEGNLIREARRAISGADSRYTKQLGVVKRDEAILLATRTLSRPQASQIQRNALSYGDSARTLVHVIDGFVAHISKNSSSGSSSSSSSGSSSSSSSGS